MNNKEMLNEINRMQQNPTDNDTIISFACGLIKDKGSDNVEEFIIDICRGDKLVCDYIIVSTEFFEENATNIDRRLAYSIDVCNGMPNINDWDKNDPLALTVWNKIALSYWAIQDAIFDIGCDLDIEI